MAWPLAVIGRRCVRAIGKGRRPDQWSDDEKRAGDQFADEAMEALTQALAQDPAVMARLLRDPRLDILRARQGYRELLAPEPDFSSR